MSLNSFNVKRWLISAVNFMQPRSREKAPRTRLPLMFKDQTNNGKPGLLTVSVLCFSGKNVEQQHINQLTTSSIAKRQKKINLALVSVIYSRI